jgi:hypothetical protein
VCWYLALLTVVSVNGVVDDTIARNPRWQLVADIVCGLSLLVFVFAWWLPSVNRVVGATLPILLVLAIAWEVFAQVRDYRQLTASMGAGDPTEPPRVFRRLGYVSTASSAEAARRL